MVATPQSDGTSTPPLLRDNFERVNTGGALQPDPTAALDERARITAFNLNVGDLAREVGMIPDGAGVIRAKEFNAIKDKREGDRKRQELIEAIRRLDEINRRLADLYEEREGILQDMRETQERIDMLTGAIGQIEEDGDVERNPDGSISDPNIEARLRDYERRTGQRVDRHDPEILLLALRAQLAHESGEMGRHEERKRDVDRQIEETRREFENEAAAIERNDPHADISEQEAAFAAHEDGVSSQARISDELSATTIAAATENQTNVFDEDYNEIADDDVGFGFDAGADEYDSFADQALPIEASEPSDTADATPNPSAPDPDMSGPDDDPENSNGAGGPSGPGMGGGM